MSFPSQQTRSETCQWWNYSNWCPTNDIIQNRNCTPHKYSVDTREGVINPGRVFWNSEILIQWVDKWPTDHHHHLQSPLNPKLEDSIIWHQLQTCPLSPPSLISIQSSELNFNITEKCHSTELQSTIVPRILQHSYEANAYFIIWCYCILFVFCQ